MALSGLEIKYLIQEISKQVDNYYLSNIYGISRSSILFKLHHPEKDDLFLVLSTFGIWLTTVRIDSVDKNRLVKRLRSDLLRFRLTEIKQIGAERIAYLTFSGFDKKFTIVAELFSSGNIILCNEDMKILALLHSIETRHRTLKVGLQYTPPPENSMDVSKLTEDDLRAILAQDMSCAKWIGRNLGFSSRYVEYICAKAQVDTKLSGNQLDESTILRLYDVIRVITNDVINGNHQPTLVKSGDKMEANPIPLHHDSDAIITPKSSFMECLDSMFTASIMDEGRDLQSSNVDKKIEELNSQLDEQKQAIKDVEEKSAIITNVANIIMTMPSKNITTLDDPRCMSILSAFNFSIITEKGRSLIKIDQKTIPFTRDSSLQATASSLYDEAKRQFRAIASIRRRQDNTISKLDELERETTNLRSSITMSAVRKKSWYERYRWFYTSDHLLSIGGRDSSSNSAIVRKHLKNDDLAFHAEIHGSPFFILKRGIGAKSTSLDETAYATVCFSRAWKEGLYGCKAYWVNHDQVKKSAPSGQSMPRGSYMIEGKRNFVRVSSLRLAVGLVYNDGTAVVTCGPVEPIRVNCAYYAVIEPTGSYMPDLAKKLKIEFAKMDEEIIQNITVDDLVRVLPTGNSHITESGKGLRMDMLINPNLDT